MIRTPLPQLVPSHVCFQCEVCCRFPDRDSLLRPYFTETEIREAVGAGVDPASFSDPRGCQVSLVPHPGGEGYVCPAFDVTTAQCRIYDVRPLDCQIYPLAVMWNADQTQVVLGWDTKCPFARMDPGYEGRGNEGGPDVPPTHAEPLSPQSSVLSPGGRVAPAIEAYADRVAALLERDESVSLYRRHPRLIGRFQDDVVVLRPLPKVTEGLRPSATSHQRSAISLRPLAISDREEFDRVCAAQETPLAAYAFAYHVIWQHLFTFSWVEVEGHLCLFAEYADGLFMPLPPLPFDSQCITHHASRAAACCFQFMRERNKGSAVSRIENIPEEWKPGYEALGYRLRPKAPDYLYRTAALARLAGDPYKSQRAACNRFEREQAHTYDPYREPDLEACLKLYRTWVRQQETEGPAASDPMARAMLKDAELAHRTALAQAGALGLMGRVVRVGREIRAYTVGYPRSATVYCVLHEVADRTMPGLAQFLFRESCRELEGRGYAWVNTMDDSGLSSLARSKRAYHPDRMVTSYIATESETKGDGH